MLKCFANVPAFHSKKNLMYKNLALFFLYFAYSLNTKVLRLIYVLVGMRTGDLWCQKRQLINCATTTAPFKSFSLWLAFRSCGSSFHQTAFHLFSDLVAVDAGWVAAAVDVVVAVAAAVDALAAVLSSS